MKLLVPLDTSTLAEQAVPAAAAIAKAREASEIRLVLVHERLRYGRYRDAHWNNTRSSMERAYLESKAREVGSIVAIPIIVEHPTGGVVDAIGEIAKSAGTGLIVMTTHGRTGSSRTWLGSVADGVMRSAGAPVLMLRPSDHPTPGEAPAGSFSRVLIPLDGSGEAETILDEAVAVVGHAATYILARVVQPVPLFVPSADPSAITTMMTDSGTTDRVAADARQYVQEIAAKLAVRGITTVEQSVLVGDHAAQMLLDFAHSIDVDLIALATHGRGMSPFVVGSVADKILRGSRTPLLVCRRVP